MKTLLLTILIISSLFMFSCQKSYENNTEMISLLKDIKYNDSLLLTSFKALQKQVDSLLKVTNSNTVQLNLLKTTIDSVQSKLINILSQLNTSATNTINIQNQLTQLLTLYQSLLLQITNMQYSCGLSDSLKKGLLAYYPFTGNAYDSSGNGNNGTVNGAILTIDRFGNTNSAYKFGTNKNIIVNTPMTDLNLQSSFSLSVWFNLDTLATTYNASLLVSKHDGDIGNDGWNCGVWNDSNYPYQFINLGGNSTTSSGYIYSGTNGAISINKWYHFVVMYDNQSNIITYYLNGSNIASKTIVLQQLANSLPLTIGFQKSSLSKYNGYFRGAIDEIRIYNRVLTNSEIQYLYLH